MKRTQARRVTSFDDLLEPGQFQFTGRVNQPDEIRTGILFVCPCGCGAFAGITLDVPEAQGLSGPKWKWDGNEDAPTITPSIRRLDGCQWHGFLTAGVFIEC